MRKYGGRCETVIAHTPGTRGGRHEKGDFGSERTNSRATGVDAPRTSSRTCRDGRRCEARRVSSSEATARGSSRRSPGSSFASLACCAMTTRARWFGSHGDERRPPRRRRRRGSGRRRDPGGETPRFLCGTSASGSDAPGPRGSVSFVGGPVGSLLLQWREVSTLLTSDPNSIRSPGGFELHSVATPRSPRSLS